VGLEDAFEKAWDDIRHFEPQEMCHLAGVAPPDGRGWIWVPMLGENYAVLLEEGRVLQDGKDPAREDKGLIVLHYLIGAMALEPSGNLISFRELRGGDVYWAAYEGRSIRRIQDFFGDRPEALTEAVTTMEHKRAGLGDIGYTIKALPKIPVTVVVWKGDEEIPAAANVLWDDSIRYFLHTEDVAVLGGIVASELIKRAPLD